MLAESSSGADYFKAGGFGRFLSLSLSLSLPLSLSLFLSVVVFEFLERLFSMRSDVVPT